MINCHNRESVTSTQWYSKFMEREIFIELFFLVVKWGTTVFQNLMTYNLVEIYQLFGIFSQNESHYLIVRAQNIRDWRL